jgi:hypothetical protein
MSLQLSIPVNLPLEYRRDKEPDAQQYQRKNLQNQITYKLTGNTVLQKRHAGSITLLPVHKVVADVLVGRICGFSSLLLHF